MRRTEIGRFEKRGEEMKKTRIVIKKKKAFSSMLPPLFLRWYFNRTRTFDAIVNNNLSFPSLKKPFSILLIFTLNLIPSLNLLGPFIAIQQYIRRQSIFYCGGMEGGLVKKKNCL